MIENGFPGWTEGGGGAKGVTSQWRLQVVRSVGSAVPPSTSCAGPNLRPHERRDLESQKPSVTHTHTHDVTHLFFPITIVTRRLVAKKDATLCSIVLYRVMQ